MTNFVGTAEDDTFFGTKKTDFFGMSQGGNDTVFGNGGKDHFYFGAAFTAEDSIDAGFKQGRHQTFYMGTVELNGDYSAGVVFGAATMVNVRTLVLDGGHSYDFTFNQTTVADNPMTVDARALGAGDALVLDISAGRGIELLSNAGHIEFIGGATTSHLTLGQALTASDRIDGGAGQAIISLGASSGAANLVLDGFSNIASIRLGSGQIHNFAATDGFVAAGMQTAFDGSDGMGGASNLTFTFDGSAETDGSFSFGFMTGAVSITTGAGNDEFERVAGTIHSGGGDDYFNTCGGTIDCGTGDASINSCNGVFDLESSGHVGIFNSSGTYRMGATLDLGDHLQNIQGTVVLDGDYSAGLVLSGLTAVAALRLAAGHDYDLTASDNNVVKDGRMTIDGSALGADDTLHFDGSAETDGRLMLIGGAGDDVLIGGKASILTGGGGEDQITGGLGSDTLTGGGGADRIDGGAGGKDKFDYTAASESTGSHYDTIVGFDVSRDAFVFDFQIKGVDAHVMGGTLDDTTSRTFNQDLAAAVDAAHLGSQHAVLFTPDSGTLAGHVFLIVDRNGIAGYQGTEDFVIDVTNGVNIGALTIANFH